MGAKDSVPPAANSTSDGGAAGAKIVPVHAGPCAPHTAGRTTGFASALRPVGKTERIAGLRDLLPYVLRLMAPECLYTLRELAELTGRSYDHWDRQCRQGRIAYLQPELAGTRLVPESAYDAWFLGGAETSGGTQAASRAPVPVGRQEWVDFDA